MAGGFAAGGEKRVIRLKACRRCRGDLLRESDIYGERWVCLACGHEEIGRAKGAAETVDWTRDRRGRKARMP